MTTFRSFRRSSAALVAAGALALGAAACEDEGDTGTDPVDDPAGMDDGMDDAGMDEGMDEEGMDDAGMDEGMDEEGMDEEEGGA